MSKKVKLTLVLILAAIMLTATVLLVACTTKSKLYGTWYNTIQEHYLIINETSIIHGSGTDQSIVTDKYTYSNGTISYDGCVKYLVAEHGNVLYKSENQIVTNSSLPRNGKTTTMQFIDIYNNLSTIVGQDRLLLTEDGTYSYFRYNLTFGAKGVYKLKDGILTMYINDKPSKYWYIDKSGNIYDNVYIKDLDTYLPDGVTQYRWDKNGTTSTNSPEDDFSVTFTEHCRTTHLKLSLSETCSYCNKTFYLKIADAVLMYEPSEKYMQAEFYGEVADSCFDFLNSYIRVIVIGNNVKEIKNSAFDWCENLTDIIFENDSHCTSIGNHAFSVCRSLTKVELPNSITSIGDYAFANCSNLSDIYVPDSVFNIGRDVMEFTEWENKQPSNELIYLGKVAYKYKGTMPENTVITLREGTIGVAGWCFFGRDSLIEVLGYENLRCIGDEAFELCTNLQKLPISNCLEIIGVRCFSDCSSIETVVLPSSITKIGNKAFWGNIKKVFYYKGLVSTGYGDLVYNPSLSYWCYIDWGDIGIYGNCKFYCYSETEPPLNEEQTDYDGSYWHYDSDGNIIIWEKDN